MGRIKALGGMLKGALGRGKANPHLATRRHRKYNLAKGSVTINRGAPRKADMSAILARGSRNRKGAMRVPGAMRDALNYKGIPGRAISGAGSIAEGGSKGLAFATFAPLAAIGFPIMHAGMKGAGLGLKAAKGLGTQTGKNLLQAVSTPRGRTTLGLGAAALGTGMATGGVLSQRATEISNLRRDPANSMGLSQNLHYAHRRG